MSKGLEALRRICFHLVAHDETQHREFDEYVSVIEKELKEYEQLKQLKLLPYPQENGEEYRQNVIKRLMALEIIKDKNVDVKYLYYHDFNLKEYNDNYIVELTQEECDLLKEVLL